MTRSYRESRCRSEMLCTSTTRGDMHQIARRIKSDSIKPNYDSEEIIEVLNASGLFALLAFLQLGGLATSVQVTADVTKRLSGEASKLCFCLLPPSSSASCHHSAQLLTGRSGRTNVCFRPKAELTLRCSLRRGSPLLSIQDQRAAKYILNRPVF